MNNVIDKIEMARNVLENLGISYPNYINVPEQGEYTLTIDELFVIAKALHLSEVELLNPNRTLIKVNRKKHRRK